EHPLDDRDRVEVRAQAEEQGLAAQLLEQGLVVQLGHRLHLVGAEAAGEGLQTPGRPGDPGPGPHQVIRHGGSGDAHDLYSFFDPRAWASRRSTPVTGVRADAVPADTSSAAAAGVSSTAAIAGVGTTGAGVPVVWGRVVVDAAAVPLIV